MLKIGAIIALLTALIGAVMTALARHRASQQEQVGGCVSCGSPDIALRGAEQVCHRCGYVGRADRGGQLSPQELASLHAPPDRE